MYAYISNKVYYLFAAPEAPEVTTQIVPPAPEAPEVTAQIVPPGAVVVGNTVDLVCEAITGRAPISLSWTNNFGNSIFPDDTDGTISIFILLTNYGTYTCTGTNDFGTATASVEVVQGNF